RCKRPRSSPHPATRTFRSTIPTRDEYQANVVSLRRELGALEREPVRTKPPPPSGVEVAARLGLSVADWSRARETFAPGATWRDIKRELYRRITAGEPTRVSTVK